MSVTIYRGYSKTISFSLKDATTKDPIDLTEAQIASGGNIKAELVTPDLTLLPTLAVLDTKCEIIGDVLLGKFDVILHANDNSTLTKGSYTLQGQVDFDTDRDPIEFSQQVLIKDLPV